MKLTCKSASRNYQITSQPLRTITLDEEVVSDRKCTSAHPQVGMDTNIVSTRHPGRI
jgi:hypothetical protein